MNTPDSSVLQKSYSFLQFPKLKNKTDLIQRATKYTPSDLAKAWKYRSKYRSRNKKIRRSVPIKYRKMLKKMFHSMPPYSGSDLCGYDAWSYLRLLMDIKTVGVAPVVGKYSFQKLQKKFPKASKWAVVFERKNIGKIKARRIKGYFDRFKKVGSKWYARPRSDNRTGYIKKELKMFDLIRIGTGINSKREPTGLHYVVWLGGDGAWVIESLYQKVLSITQYAMKRGGISL